MVSGRLERIGSAVQESWNRCSPSRLLNEQIEQIQWKYSHPTGRIRRNVVSASCHG